MNGVEVGAWNFSHHFARSTDDFELRSLLARTRMVDQQQQTTIIWLHPADRSVLETEIFPGRPASEHHNDPEVRLLRHYEKNRALPLSRIHTLTLLCGEQQTYNFYKVESRSTDKELKERYQEFGQETAWIAQAKSEALLASALLWGPLGQAEQEASDLENVLLAETKDHADWELLNKLAELSLKAITQEPPPDPARLDRCVIQPDVNIAPIDKRSLSDGAKLPSAQATPASRTSVGS